MAALRLELTEPADLPRPICDHKLARTCRTDLLYVLSPVVDIDPDSADQTTSSRDYLALALASRRAADLPDEIENRDIWRDFSRAIML